MLELESLADVRSHERVGGRDVELLLLGAPVELDAWETLGDAADENALHLRDAVLDVCKAARVGLLVVGALAEDGVDELAVVPLGEALHLDRRLAVASGRLLAAERDRARDGLGGLVLEHVLELGVGLERDCALCAVVVLHENLALAADHEAACVRDLALVLRRPLRHELGSRLFVAVVPVERDGRKLDAGTHLRVALLVGELDDRLERIRDVVLGLDHRALRVGDAAELKAAEREVHRVAGHVAERAGAEVEEAAPRERVVDVLAEVPRIVDVGVLRILVEERTVGGRGEPRIPVETLADGIALRVVLDPLCNALALRPHGTVRPNVDFPDVAEDAALEDLGAAAHRVERRALVAHLHDYAVLAGGLLKVLELPEGADEGLLNVDVDALLHRLDRDRRVDVVRRRDRHRVDAELVGVVEELAVVGVERNLREVEVGEVLLRLFKRLVQHVGVCIAERDHLDEAGLEHRRPVAVALAHDTDGREADLLSWLAGMRREASARAKQRNARETAEKTSSAGIDHLCFPFWLLVEV